MQNLGSVFQMEEGDLSTGTSDRDMIGRLKEEGVPPKDIDDALNRAKIRSAVSADLGPEENMQPSIMRPGKPEPLPTEGAPLSDEDLAPPIIESREIDRTPKTREISEESYVPQPQKTQEEYVPSQQNSAQDYAQGYAPQETYGEYATRGITDTDTMIEISEQVFSEKIKTIQKQVESMNEFKTLAETKIEYISTRLKRIETVLDNLQTAILEKVGVYGRGLEGIKKEMSMMQDSFGKMVGNLAQKHHTQHHTTHMTKKKAHKKVKKISRKR